MEVILDNHYINGMRDAREGYPARSEHPNYQRGYSAQIQLDEITSHGNNGDLLWQKAVMGSATR